MKKSPLLTLTGMWLAWVAIILVFQVVVPMRITLRRPDNALFWTATETMANSQNGKPTLLDPFMNQHVSWDSEFYLSIAINGYNDPAVRTLPPFMDPNGYSLNYAFYPLYPVMIKLIALPARWAGMLPIPAATLAGVIVSLLGALGAILALHTLVKDELGDEGGIRAAFYLLIYPMGFFLAQVYTEGLFLLLCFGSMALVYRRKWAWAAVLGALATWTRPGGMLLVIPLGWAWLEDRPWRALSTWKERWSAIGKTAAAAAPALAYFAWRLSPLAEPFDVVEKTYFGRLTLAFGQSFGVWSQAFLSIFGDNRQASVYYAIEFVAIILAVLACILTLKRYPGVSLFGLAIIVLALTSGQAQGMARYVMAVPSLFIVLARWGRNPVFDRSWTTVSILLLGLLTTLFSFDMWVA